MCLVGLSLNTSSRDMRHNEIKTVPQDREEKYDNQAVCDSVIVALVTETEPLCFHTEGDNLSAYPSITNTLLPKQLAKYWHRHHYSSTSTRRRMSAFLLVTASVAYSHMNRPKLAHLSK